MTSLQRQRPSNFAMVCGARQGCEKKKASTLMVGSVIVLVNNVTLQNSRRGQTFEGESANLNLD